MKLFGSGMLQVLLVTFNTWQIANDKVVGAILIGFSISFLWTYNVRKVAFGSMAERLLYSSGAGVGGGIGVTAAGWWYS